MIGRADIEGSKSDVAMNAWPPQASYPCVGFPWSVPVLSCPLHGGRSGYAADGAAAGPPGDGEPTPGRTAGRDAASDRSSVVPRSADGDGPATASRLPVRRPGARATAGVSPAPPTLLRRPEPDPPRSSEPILIPKLRIGFADFPYLHYSMRLEAAHLGDLLRISVRTDAKTPRGPLSNFQGPRGGHGHRRNERCSSRSRPYRPARGFQGRTTLTEKRELFPDPPAASSSSFRSPGRDKRAPNTRERFRVGFRNTDRIPSRPMGDSKTPSPVVRGSLPGLRID
ncbi:hypothetical protein AGLY_018283 [Aphis glycines]|uniref:Uncharacterized protein n=1 Tax=Aphis glycines TaxID=307491 RepID=A0A6G0SSM7_APHGL|nr:hypothetical protein AGLY_018283 [Aphis glycines]